MTMELGRIVEALGRDGGIGEVGSFSKCASFPISMDWPRSWRYDSRGGVDGAETGACGKGLSDCLAALYMLPVLVCGRDSGLLGEESRPLASLLPRL